MHIPTDTTEANDRPSTIGRRRVLTLGALGLAAAVPMAGAAPAPAEAVTADPDDTARKVWWLDPEVAGPSFTPAERRDHIRGVLAEIAAAGGGTLEWPGVEFVVDRPSGTDTIWATVPTNTTIRGRAGSALTLDPLTAGSTVGMIMLQFGQPETDTRFIHVDSLTVNCNESVIGGGSIWAVGSRRETTDLSRVDDIQVTRCTFRDCRVAVSATQSTPQTDRGAGQHRRWRIEGCYFEKNSNRMIELSQVDGALISGNFFVDATTAVHLISFTRNVTVTGNVGFVIERGVMINFGVTDCIITNNVFRFASGVAVSTGSLVFHSEPNPTTFTVQRLRFANNFWGCPTAGSTRRSLTTSNTPAAVSITRQDISFNGDTFEGDVVVAPGAARAAGHVRGWTFEGCSFAAAFATLAPADFDLTDFDFTNCRFLSSAPHTFLSARTRFRSCTWTAGVSVAATATQQLFDSNVWPVALADAGTGTQIGTNFVQ